MCLLRRGPFRGAVRLMAMAFSGRAPSGRLQVGLRAFGIVVASALVVLWAASGTQRERPILAGDLPAAVRALEANAAAHPDDPDAAQALAGAYLDAQQPGLAVGLLEGAPEAVRADLRTRHLYARALLEEGRNDDALAAESRVVGACMPPEERAASVDATASHGVDATQKEVPRGCDALLLGQALRRESILRELVALGVEDTRAHPEQSFVAYQNATREARVALY